MKANLTQEKLNKGLIAVSRIVGSRTTLPVLANVLLQIENNRLRMTATNLELGITYWVGAKVENSGKITVPAKLLSEYINNLPEGNILLETDKNTLQLQSGGFSSKINGIDADEFPSIPKVEGKVRFKATSKTIKDSLSQVVGVASGDDSRPVLTGIYLHTDDGILYAVATDSYRLAEKQVMECDQEFNVIVPARTITELLRLLDEDTELEIKADDNQISFVFGETELVSRLIDGQFPNYRQLIPEEIPTNAKVETDDLRGVTKVASLFARENAGSVTLSITEKGLNMRSVASQVGENSSDLEAEVSGDAIEVSLNGRYISDALQVIDTKQVDVGLTGKVNPCVIRPVGDDSYLHIIMPLRS